MTFQQAVEKCLRKYAEFSGRAARPEFWWFVLFLILGNIVLGAVDGILFNNSMVLSGLFWLGTLLPTLGVSVRRLHDIGKSGWWLLLHLIPVIGLLVLIYFYIQQGEPDGNEYGPPPPA